MPRLPYNLYCVGGDVKPCSRSECPDVKITNEQLNPVWHRMLYSCSNMATVGVKGFNTNWKQMTHTERCTQSNVINVLYLRECWLQRVVGIFLPCHPDLVGMATHQLAEKSQQTQQRHSLDSTGFVEIHGGDS